MTGRLTLSLAGVNTNQVLTFNNGASDQQRNWHFVFTGALAGNVIILFPTGKPKQFSVLNNCTGFTLSIGSNSGITPGTAAGLTVTVPTGGACSLSTDGTDVTLRSNPTGIGLPTGTSGHVLGFLDTNNTISGTNTYSSPQTSTAVGGASTAGWQVVSSAPGISFNANSQAADSKKWDFVVSGTTLIMRTINDAENAAVNWGAVTRTATSSVTLALGGNTTVNGSFTQSTVANEAVILASGQGNFQRVSTWGNIILGNNAAGQWHIQPNNSTGNFELFINALPTIFSISSAGALRLSAYGAGTLVTDASGNVTAGTVLGNMAGVTYTSSTSGPSGTPADGQLWLQHA